MNTDAVEIPLASRYPETGSVRNLECDMEVRVVEGSVEFHAEGAVAVLSAGQTVSVPKGLTYFWVPRPTATLHIASSPPWTRDQQQMVE